MEYRIKLNVADTNLEVISPRPAPIAWIQKNYKAFLDQGPADFKVFIMFDRRTTQRGNEAPAVSRHWNNNTFLYKGNLFDTRADFINRRIDISAGSDFGIIDILRFVVSVILVKKNGVLLHAASLVHDGFGYVFAGPSGSGKTTICRLSKNKVTLSDETTAIIKNGRGYRVYATPFAGELGQVKENSSVPLKAIFFIHKGKDFRHSRVNRACAIANLFRNCIVDFADYTMTDTLFDTFYTVSQKIPGYDLYFKPEPRLWRYIDGRIN
jgi:hypothetical protein